jgi:two-component system, NtrC family, response regulator AtoC
MTRPTILLLDGSGYIRDAMQQYLENENFCVVASATVYGAFRQIVTKDFDVLITNLHMRRTRDGLRLVPAIRHLQPKALIVGVSDSLDKQQAAKAIRLGVDVIVKPFDVHEVAELINAKTKGFKWPPMANAETNVAQKSGRLASRY